MHARTASDRQRSADIDTILPPVESCWLCTFPVPGFEAVGPHMAAHRRSDVVRVAALENSGRPFLEGPGDVAVQLVLGMATFHGAMSRAVRAAADFAASWDRVQRAVED